MRNSQPIMMENQTGMKMSSPVSTEKDFELIIKRLDDNNMRLGDIYYRLQNLINTLKPFSEKDNVKDIGLDSQQPGGIIHIISYKISENQNKLEMLEELTDYLNKII